MTENQENLRIRAEFEKRLKFLLLSDEFALKNPEDYEFGVKDFQGRTLAVFEEIAGFADELEEIFEDEFDKAMGDLDYYIDRTHCDQWNKSIVQKTQHKFRNSILNDKEHYKQALEVAYELLFEIYMDLVDEIYITYGWYSVFIAVEDDVDLLGENFVLQINLSDYQNYFYTNDWAKNASEDDKARAEENLINRVFMYRTLQREHEV